MINVWVALEDIWETHFSCVYGLAVDYAGWGPGGFPVGRDQSHDSCAAASPAVAILKLLAPIYDLLIYTN